MYLIYALPRSRTFWLSRYLTYGDWQCSHDELMRLRSLEDLASWRKLPRTGSVETAAAPWWRLVPDVQTITIRRDPDDVIASMERAGYGGEAFRRYVYYLDKKLDQIERRIPYVMKIAYHHLSDESTCKKIFEHVLPYRHDPAWWQMMSATNLQSRLQHTMDYFAAYQPQLVKLAKTAKHQIIRDMQSTPIDHDDGLVIAEEPFDQAFAACASLAEDHCVAVGEPPDGAHTKNLALIRKLEELGCTQTMVARCNGRPFGYLLSLISPSMESPDLKIAVQTIFYADPSWKGVGLKLQRASVAALKEKGVDEVYFRAGIRGSGERVSVLYRRLGASEFGQLWKLSVK